MPKCTKFNGCNRYYAGNCQGLCGSSNTTFWEKKISDSNKVTISNQDFPTKKAVVLRAEPRNLTAKIRKRRDYHPVGN